MPEAKILKRVQKDRKQGKAVSTQAGEFVREEMHHIREGKHGARSTKQAIAIGLSKARRAGVALPPPGKGKASEKTRRSAKRAYEQGQRKSGAGAKPSARRSRATTVALKREGHGGAASTRALSRQGHAAAAKRSASSRSISAKKGASTKGFAGRSQAAKKAARTRMRNR